MQKYQYYPSMINYENLISVNKLLKANIIVYDKLLNSIYGFSQDNVDANILKIFTPTNKTDFELKYMSSMQYDFPNFVAFNKDIASLVKIASVNEAVIGMDILDYRGVDGEYAFRFGVKAFRTTIVEEERPCYDPVLFRDKMQSVLSELSLLPTSESYSNITTIPEFEYALSQSSDKGIQTVRYNNNVYFIPPTFINNTVKDTVDLICKNNPDTNTKLMNFRVNKSNGVVNIIYRQVLLPR